MAQIYKSDRDDISRQVQKATKRIERSKSPDEKDKSRLALAVLRMLAADRTENSLAQKLLRLLRDLQR